MMMENIYPKWDGMTLWMSKVMEDYSDSDSDLDSVSDSDLEERYLEDEENEIIDDVTLLTFTNVLWRAQEITVKGKNKKWGERKRPKRYTKTSVHTKQWHVQKCQKLESGGQIFIHSFFPKKESLGAPEHITENAINVGDPKNLEEVSDGIFDEFNKDSQDI